MSDTSKDYKGRTYDKKNDREVMVRFLELTVRGGQCDAVIFEFHALSPNFDPAEDIKLHVNLGYNWDHAKEKYPTFEDILFHIGGMDEFDGNGVPENFRVIRAEGYQGLYDAFGKR